MSYILDALKKSERERQRNSQDAEVRLAAVPAAESRHSWRLWALVGLVTANLTATAYFALRNPRSGPATATTAAAPDRAPSAPPALADRSAATPPQPEPPPATDDRPPTPRPQAAAEPAPARPPSAPRKERHAATPPRPEASSERLIPPRAPGVPQASAAARLAPPQPPLEAPDTPESAARPSVSGTAPPPAQELRDPAVSFPLAGESPPEVGAQPAGPTLPLGKTPPALRGRLPDLDMTVYAYSASNPAERFVIIHGRKYRPGDRMEGGAQIREINGEAMVIELDGKRIAVPRP